MARQPHKWLLKINPDAQQQFNALERSYKQVVFRKRRELLSADDPYTLQYVEMLQDKKFERIRKFRVGDFRVFFLVETTEIMYLKHSYKGKIHLLSIRNRKEAY